MIMNTPTALKDRTKGKSSQHTDETLCRSNWERYQYSRQAGHDNFIVTAIRNEDFFLGGGKQWSEQDRLARAGRPIVELNHIMPAVQTALGMQLHSRVDMDFQPRGEGADDDKARVINKVVRQICDQIEYHWHESQQYADGVIEQRGYLEYRIDFSKNFLGEIVCNLLDPCDVHPDPDSNNYLPDDWQDVVITRWLSYDGITERYGEDKAKQVERLADAYFEDDQYKDRFHFGEDADASGYNGWVKQDGDREESRLYLVIDRQQSKLVRDKVFVYFTGEVKALDLMTEQQLAFAEKEQKGMRSVADHRRIRWTVTSGGVVLFDDWSPYRTKTIIPYFFIFRRGRTRGMVCNLRSPQELENKSITNDLEIQNGVANGGFDVEQNSITNMSTGDLERHGHKNNLVIEYKKGSAKPERRQPLLPAAGQERLADRGEFAIKTISGMSDAQQGQPGAEISGKAIQSKQYAGQMQTGSPMDNLALTRRLSARKILELVQDFYTEERVFRIVDPETRDFEEDITINQVDETGGILNDVTIGRYDVVITDTPTHATFEQSQFNEMMMMLEKGVPIPPHHVIKTSSLTKKHEIVDEMLAQQEQGPPPDPETESKIEETIAAADLKKAQAEKARSEIVNSDVDAMYSAIQTAGAIAATPQTAPLADTILRSAGFEDKDAPPLMPENIFPPVDPAVTEMGGLPPNTNPTTPVPVPEPGNPAVGANAGIETQMIEESRG